MSSTYERKQPVLDPSTSRALVKSVIGHENIELQDGDWQYNKARNCSGNVNRVFSFFTICEQFGLDVNKLKNAFVAQTVGLSPDLQPYGMRGEVVQLATQQFPKKENITNTTGGIIRIGRPEQEATQ